MINASESLPHWAFFVTRGDTPKRGDIIIFSPPPGRIVRAHFGARPPVFAKRALGLPGDRIAHQGMTVLINGRPVAQRKSRTRSGLALAAGPAGKVPSGCYYAGTPHPDGFDSRYAAIGLVCRRQLVGLGQPVL